MPNVLMAADFASIESRVNAWLAGEERKLQAFRDIDADPAAPDIYKVAAADVYNCRPKDVPKGPKRQVGKVTELSMGFGGGPGALAKMAKNYRVDIGEAWGPVRAAASPANIEKMEKAWPERGGATGMTETRWKTAELIKLAWRDKNPNIVQFWKDLERAAIDAVKAPGEKIVAGKTGRIMYRKVGSFLFCRLPGGGVISYPYPSIGMKEAPWFTDETHWVKTAYGPDDAKKLYGDALVQLDAEGGRALLRKKAQMPSLSYMGVDAITKQWRRQHFYGGLGCENVVQAVSRDLMADRMIAVEAAGYPVVLTIHDEIITEPPVGHGSLEEFERIVSTLPAWAEGLPLAAEGFAASRYRK